MCEAGRVWQSHGFERLRSKRGRKRVVDREGMHGTRVLLLRPLSCMQTWPGQAEMWPRRKTMQTWLYKAPER